MSYEKAINNYKWRQKCHIKTQTKGRESFGKNVFFSYHAKFLHFPFFGYKKNNIINICLPSFLYLIISSGSTGLFRCKRNRKFARNRIVSKQASNFPTTGNIFLEFM